MEEKQTYQTSWQGIPLSVSYCPSWSTSYGEIYGYDLAHIEVRGPCPLPITETGYRSHFDRSDNIDAEGGPVAFVLAWLDSEAQGKAWKKAEVKTRQLTLF